MPFGEAWFAIYPGIIEVVLFSYAVLNILAKITHRRMSDVLFGPTLLVFCGLHYFRQEIAAVRWFGTDGRVNSAMTTAQYDALKLQDFFVSDAALRLNSNIKTMLIPKLVVLGVNALPLLVSITTSSRSARTRQLLPSQMEKALGIRVFTSFGFGRCTVPPRKASPSLAAYELVRLGYVIVGEKVVMSV